MFPAVEREDDLLIDRQTNVVFENDVVLKTAVSAVFTGQHPAQHRRPGSFQISEIRLNRAERSNDRLAQFIAHLSSISSEVLEIGLMKIGSIVWDHVTTLQLTKLPERIICQSFICFGQFFFNFIQFFHISFVKTKMRLQLSITDPLQIPE